MSVKTPADTAPDTGAPGLLIRGTRDRAEVEHVLLKSLELVRLGLAEKEDDWEPGSIWYNTKFTHVASGAEWVVYLADHAWPGEVRVLNAAGIAEISHDTALEQEGHDK
jgi:hypothetical protein